MHKPRLIISGIKVQNFKSYKGEHIVMGLDPYYTAIVGPNGCGKSNIIDCILFVLGFKAKKMRQSTAIDLIFNDGKRCDMCYVEIHFSRWDGFEATPAFVIKREVYANKKNFYYLNGESVNASIISELMTKEGVDMEHNRFLIMQGEIESIAQMKPKSTGESKIGLLEYLEDIIGTAKYLPEIENLEKEVLGFAEETELQTSKFLFYEKEFKHIEEIKNENERLIREKIELLNSKYKFLHAKLEVIKRNKTKNLIEQQSVSERLKELKTQEHNEALQKLEQDIKKIKEEMKNKEDSLAVLRKEYRRLERESALNEEKRNKLSRLIENMKEEINNSELKNKMNENERKALIKEISDNNNELLKYTSERDEIKNKLKELNGKLSTKETKKYYACIKKCEDSMLSLLQKRNKLIETDCLQEEELSNAEYKIKRLNDEIENLKKERERLFKILANIKQESNISKINEEIKQVNLDYEKTEAELFKRINKAEELRKQWEMGKKENEVMNKIRNIKGVIGKLNDLGSIESKYDMAISMAGKGALANIVVDTTKTAEKCIDAMKGMSRTTFIILDKIKDIPNLPKMEVPYLFELVECDEKYKKAFYFALKDTLICESHEQAKRLAFGPTRNRTITLDGKMIDKSGLMSGGGNFYRGCGLKGEPIELKKYEKEATKLKSALEKINTVRQNLYEKLEMINQREAYEIKIKLITEEMAEKSEEVDILMKKTQFKKKDNENDIQMLDSKIEKLKEEISKNESILNSLGGEEINSLKCSLSILIDKIGLLENRNKDLKLKIDGYIIEDTKEMKRKLISLEQNFINLKNYDPSEYEYIKKEFQAKEFEFRNIFNEFKLLNDEYIKVKQELNEDYQLEVKYKSMIEELNENIENANKSICKLTKEIERIKNEIKGISFILKEKSSFDLIDYSSFSDEELKKIIEKEQNFDPGSNFINLQIFEEFYNKKNQFDQIKAEYNNFKELVASKTRLLEELKGKRLTEFMDGFNRISGYVKEIYQTITFGGNAELELVDYLDPFTEGVILSVMPPKKSWKNITNLSGGEKTLSSLALVFALHLYKPSPFYVMDEIDAALDYRNVSVIANFINEKTKDAQFLVISLRNDMFELSNVMLGVYKTNNLSRMLLIDLKKLS
ncbi:Structural maintenance of chromosomes protein 4 [Astathelohania contejeani]|uniref:Structural maintenance of chromosomes protein 4 n=1 Tax=Astathelohania contejeani TaxID=164912 RepID=A0ABQ7I0J2_9MICR|nr:Structural maintenance of chromosomes protein 4 [Thelohania contejeani]